LRSRFTNMDLLHGSNRVYTSLDTVLQRAAVDAVRATLGKIDHQIASDPRWEDYPATEVALVALEPRTGEVRALVGGRKYDVGAVEGKYEVPKNRSLENVLPGPMFFPFDYAAAISAARSGDPIPSSAISAAQKAGYEAVASLANRCGLYHDAKPLQALAMGNERTSPLSVAAAYTVFANLGTCVQPALVLSVRDDKNNLVFKYEPAQEAVLESSSASRLLQLLQTGVTEARAIRVNREDSSAPALVLSGKSRDAWAVGFTSRLLAVVWLGYDDREFPLDSSVSATRVWTDFMSRATKLPRYAETGAGAPSTTARAGGTSVPRRRRSQK
jgi:penicillin-binding protein 1B